MLENITIRWCSIGTKKFVLYTKKKIHAETFRNGNILRLIQIATPNLPFYPSSFNVEVTVWHNIQDKNTVNTLHFEIITINYVWNTITFLIIQSNIFLFINPLTYINSSLRYYNLT